MIKRFLNWLSPAHAWDYSSDHVERRCSVCGQMEQYGIGDEFGQTWDEIVPGVRAMHALPSNRQRTAPPVDAATAIAAKLNA